MTIRMMSGTQGLAVVALVLAFLAPGGAVAEEHGYSSAAGRGSGGGGHQHVDSRFSHNHSYFDRGYGVRNAPRGGYAIDHGRDHYWYHGGHWYGRGGPGWVVAGAPLGAFVAILPPFYTTVWFGGVPYYYANDTYYSWSGERQQYEVVAPPDGIESAGTTEPPPSDSMFVYPRNGQSAEQEARDRYECHHFALEQTGFDPTETGGGVPPEVAARKRADYSRAEAACLDARGYSVR
jgi:hypothetical protein